MGKRTFKVGDRVRLVSDEPRAGFGAVNTGDVGVIISIGDRSKDTRTTAVDHFRVDFPKQNFWLGYADEFELDGPPPYKHIKYKAEIIPPNLEVIKITILEQTEIGEKFGNWAHSFKHGKITLKSSGFPDYYLEEDKYVVYMRGDTPSRDSNPIYLPVDIYPSFRSAIESYNAYFTGGEKPKEKESKQQTPKKVEPWQKLKSYFGSTRA